MMYNPFSLEGKTILVTGASSGIGRATAIECSKMGASVIITARNQERLKQTIDMLEGSGHQFFLADVTKEADIALLVEQLPKLDGFVNNAGVVNTKPLPFYKEDEIETMFRTNTLAAILLTQSIVRRKKFNKPSSIVITSSAGGVYGHTPGNGMYDMTKAALHSFMVTAALELAPKGIRCNSVNPAMVNTVMAETLDSISEEQLAIDKKKYPLGRYADPREIALAIVYLLSDAT